MRKVTFIMLCVLSLFLSACTKKQPTLDFENKQITVQVGDDFTLTPQITNLEGTDLVNYVIEDNTVISLTNGKFVALKAGSTTITASLKENAEVSVTIHVTVSALPEFTITYQLNNGTNETSAPIKYSESNLPLLLPIPTKVGSTFLGWYESSDFSGQAVTTIPAGAAENKTYYAKWELNEFTITYVLNGGTNPQSAPTSFNHTQLPITLPIPTKDNYTFLGWFESSEFTGLAVSTLPAGATGNKTYYAKWEINNYTITYVLNGGTNPQSAPTSYNHTQLPISLPTPTKEGYTFLGWFETSEFTGLAVTTIPAEATGNKTYYAKWELTNYSISYHANGGTVPSSASTTYNRTQLPMTLLLPTKEGYTFLGWYETENFSGDAVTTLVAGSTGNKAYYAKWEIINYSISYELNGGTQASSAPTSYNIAQFPITLPNPTRNGYAFLGWYETSDFTGQAVSTLSVGTIGNKTFYAKWIEAATFTLTYQLDGGTNSSTNKTTYTMFDLPLTISAPTKPGYTFLGWYLTSTFDGEPVTIIEVANNYTLYAKWEIIQLPVTDVYVNPALLGTTAGTIVTYNGTNYTFGRDAFATLSEGLSATNGRVYLEGTFTESVTISKSNVSLIGPNAYLNPNTASRTEEAIIKGTITIASGVDNIIINGLAFTETGKVKGSGVIKNVQFMYNYVYDTTEATTAWLETAGYTSGFFAFTSANNNELVNFTFLNNKFSNVSDVNINFSRVTHVTFEGNTFKNFDRDALRFDTGGFNQGNLTFVKNEFVNDVLGGYNGIYFRIYGGDQNTPTNIKIENNLFKNIGQVTKSIYSGAISMRNYQEKLTTIEIVYNTFENCANYIHIRNNGLATNHAAYPWSAKANYNVFKGVPVAYYYKNWTGSDTASSNPPTMNFDFNYFEDNNGNPITDLTQYVDKLLNLSSYANNYQSRSEYDDMLRDKLIGKIDLYVSADWATKASNETFEYKGKTLTYGVNAFGSLSSAMINSVAGYKIYVLPGTYSDAVTISLDNITILTDNMDIDPNIGLRKPEAIITGVVSISANVKNLTINGLAFTENAYVTSLGSISDFNFTYNNFFNSKIATGDTGLVYLKTTGSTNTLQHYRLVFTNNRFQATGNPRLINIDKAEDLIVRDNYFETANSSYADALRVYYLSSTNPVVIKGNTFKNIFQFAIFFSASHKATQIDIINNTFDTVNSAIQVRTYNGTATAEQKAIVNVLYNTFKNVTDTAVRVDHNGTVDTSVLDINVNYNHFADAKPVYYFSRSASNTGTAANLDFNFFFEGVNPTATKLVGVYSSQNNYISINDLPKYDSNNTVIYPTSIIINNPINTLEELSTHQLNLTVNPTNATVKKVIYSSSNSNIISVTPTGLITAKAKGMATITVKSEANPSVIAELTITVTEKERIELSYEGNGALEINQSLLINHTIFPNNEGTLIWESSNESIASVDQNGLVTAKASGTVIITATLTNTDIKAQVGLTVYGTEVTDELLKYLIQINTGVLTTQELYYIGSDDGSADYLNRIYNSVSAYQFSDYSVVRNMLPTDRANYSGVQMTSIEFITVHDTAGSGAGSTALANSNWATNLQNTSTSWHYTVGNDGVYQQVEDSIKAYHAGDGSRVFGLNDTGVVATSAKPVITVNSSGYFVLNGVESTIQAPAIAPITPSGIYTTIGSNGNYWMNNTWYSSGYNVIGNQGGNMNSIGIEMAVNNGSDVYLTWQTTAKLSADLAVKYNLGADRVLFHNNFSGKLCPRTMLTAGLQDEFDKLVEAEYTIAKNYSDYTITFVSHNPSIIDNTGRVIGRPMYTTNVTYTITVTKGTSSQSITLNALVPGQFNY